MARFEVYISDEGLAAIDGEPLVPAPGQSVHEAVLDQLQRYAVARSEVVEATVTDSPDTGHFILEVSPDGSSRLLTTGDAGDEDPEPGYGPDPGYGPEPAAPEPAAPEPGAGPEAEPGAGSEAVPEAGPEAVAGSGTGVTSDPGQVVAGSGTGVTSDPGPAVAGSGTGVTSDPGPAVAGSGTGVTSDPGPAVAGSGTGVTSDPGPAVAGSGTGVTSDPGQVLAGPGPVVVTRPGPVVAADPGPAVVTHPGPAGPAVAADPGSSGRAVATGSETGGATGSGPAAPTGSATAVATAVARATAAARAAAHAPSHPPALSPSHPPAPSSSHAPSPVPDRVPPHVPAVALPAELAGRISRINALAARGRLDEAYALATELRESLTGAVGAEDPHAVEARAVEAYIAHLCGDHREAIVLALAVARIRCRAGDPRAPEEVARAAAAWQWLDDEHVAVAHGRELLHMWDRLGHRGLLPPAHAELAGRIRRRVDALGALV
ncbi:hypothetical protein [Streptomyces sediminimaris]|uniref:hypothetical protein n=1 Tax=Streptomyces sediminimaris TaxID=3383721 RepID=UPI00399ADFA4